MALTVSMARALGLTRLAVPTQGNAGGSLAEYAVAAGSEAVIVMAPAAGPPVRGRVAALSRVPPALRVPGGRHRAPAPGPDDGDRAECGAEPRACQRPADHPRDGRLRARGHRGGHRRRDPRRMATSPVRLVTRGRRDPRRAPRAGRPGDDPSQRPCRPGQHGLGREIPALDPRTARRRTLKGYPESPGAGIPGPPAPRSA